MGYPSPGSFLSLPILRTENGQLRAVSGATVKVYKSLASGGNIISPVTPEGAVSPLAQYASVKDTNGVDLTGSAIPLNSQGELNIWVQAVNYCHLLVTTSDRKVFGIPWISVHPATFSQDLYLVPGDDLQGAIDSLDGPGTIRLAPGDYPLLYSLRIPKDLTIVGAGKEVTTIRVLDNCDLDVIQGLGPNIRLTDFTIFGPGGGGAGVGLGLYPPATGSFKHIYGCLFSRLRIKDTGTYNLYVQGIDASSYCSDIVFDDCEFSEALSTYNLQVDDYSTNLHFRNCSFLNSGGDTDLANANLGTVDGNYYTQSLLFDGCKFDIPLDTASIFTRSCIGTSFRNCIFTSNFLDINHLDKSGECLHWFIEPGPGNLTSLTLDSCRFIRKQTNKARVLKTNGDSAAVGILVNNILALVALTPTSSTDDFVLSHSDDDLILNGGLCMSADFASVSGPSVSGTGNLMKKIGLHRFKLPARTATQINNLSNPRTGDIVFDSTNAVLKCYNGTAWKTVVFA